MGGQGVPAGTEVVIWTTTPWTLPAIMAVALNPGEDYCVVEDAGRRFLVASRLAESFIRRRFRRGGFFRGWCSPGRPWRDWSWFIPWTPPASPW
jgi:hypothetical protein